jgi:hypothetical protein
MAVNISIVVFWIWRLVVLYVITNVSEERIAFIFRVGTKTELTWHYQLLCPTHE